MGWKIWKVWFISILGDEVYTWVKADSFDEAMERGVSVPDSAFSKGRQ